ncbi:hypothetical protein F2Q68_00043076 [Brassica cretica]|uniref:Uncharacterized protein n=2 Tax=Brassica cretica TaxID=69181 RepID=A0A3N6PP05_BRACR|nr:hypothetical protein F2Q68_00043076 [Brassica cretica]KAF3517101.1 hypothetical protein DY000_02058564 [Brassica cretica]
MAKLHLTNHLTKWLEKRKPGRLHSEDGEVENNDICIESLPDLLPKICCAPGESRSQPDDALYWCIVEVILPGKVKPQDVVKDILEEFMENISLNLLKINPKFEPNSFMTLLCIRQWFLSQSR